ncbi:unnamed protein product, partial [marine sediment metagenome]
SKVFFDLDLRQYFLDDVREKYEVDVFGLGKMMNIPLYIDLTEIGLSNRGKPFDLSLLESIMIEIQDSPRWPGSFIQEFEDFSVMNLPYQRVGISDIKLYNLISDSLDEDNDGFVSSTVRFVAPDYYNCYAESEFEIKRLDIEFTNLQTFAYNDLVDLQSVEQVEYSDFIEINYRWNNNLSQVLLNDIYALPVGIINSTSGETLSFGIANWITKYDKDSLSGYLTKYYYSKFEVPKNLAEFNVSFGSLGTPLFNISFLDAPTFILNV